MLQKQRRNNNKKGGMTFIPCLHFVVFLLLVVYRTQCWQALALSQEGLHLATWRLGWTSVCPVRCIIHSYWQIITTPWHLKVFDSDKRKIGKWEREREREWERQRESKRQKKSETDRGRERENERETERVQRENGYKTCGQQNCAKPCKCQTHLSPTSIKV